MLWLEHGYLEGDDTDAHIDTLARFASAPGGRCSRPVMIQPIRTSPNWGAMGAELAALRTADGKPYRLFPLPWAQPVLDAGRRLAASYANFLIINGAVLMPAYGDPADDRGSRRAGGSFPGPRDRAGALPCADLAERQPALHHHAVAGRHPRLAGIPPAIANLAGLRPHVLFAHARTLEEINFSLCFR